MSFKKLLEELNGTAADITKSMVGKEDDKGDTAADDKAIAAAAADDAGGAGSEEEQGGEAGEGDELSKSITLMGPDGKPIEVLDGGALLKALNDRVDALDSDLKTGLPDLLKSWSGIIKAQSDLIKGQAVALKSLTDKYDELANAGRGRKAVVTVVDKKPAEAKEEPAGVSSEDFMAKALTAQAGGKLTGIDVSRAEAYINRGMQPPAEIVRKVLGN